MGTVFALCDFDCDLTQLRGEHMYALTKIVYKVKWFKTKVEMLWAPSYLQPCNLEEYLIGFGFSC